jgi:hypothetical protein
VPPDESWASEGDKKPETEKPKTIKQKDKKAGQPVR